MNFSDRCQLREMRKVLPHFLQNRDMEASQLRICGCERCVIRPAHGPIGKEARQLRLEHFGKMHAGALVLGR